MEIKTRKLIHVFWKDQSWYHGPTQAEGAISPMYGQTVGWLIDENEEWVCVSCEVFKSEDKDMYRHVITFPRCAIVSILRSIHRFTILLQTAFGSSCYKLWSSNSIG